MRTITLNKNKNIGKVLLIVEGQSTEFFLLRKIFTELFNYQFEALPRMSKYKKINDQGRALSSVFVINTESSNIRSIEDASGYLDGVFRMLIDDYSFPVDRAAIYYLFDRDCHSNTDALLIERLLGKLGHARDFNEDGEQQGLLLLSYPSVESFVASHFLDDSHRLAFELGKQLSAYMEVQKINQSRITEETLLHAINEMEEALEIFGIETYDLDRFVDTNLHLFHEQEELHARNQAYRLMSLLSIVFLDLGLIEVEKIER
jgi:hypothetical protein